MDGAMRVAARSDRFEPLEPMMVPARCGSAKAARPSCLARVAADGVLVFGEAVREGGDAVVTLRLVDGRGRTSPEAWFRVSLAVLTSAPAAQAMGELDAALGAGLRAARPAAPARVTGPPRPTGAAPLPAPSGSPRALPSPLPPRSSSGLALTPAPPPS